jgi:hypothetical protein
MDLRLSELYVSYWFSDVVHDFPNLASTILVTSVIRQTQDAVKR